MQIDWNGIQKWGARLTAPVLWFGGLCALFTTQKTPYEIIIGGLSMNLTPWILLIVGILILLLYRGVKPKDEALEILRFIKHAPTIAACVFMSFVFIFCWGESQSSQNTSLTAQFQVQTNPQPYLLKSGIPSDDIIMSSQDVTNLNARARQFSSVFIKEHGHKPKVVLQLCPTAKRSNHLFRQIRDSLLDGWEIEFHANNTFAITPLSTIEIYTGDIAHPPAQYDFWIKTLQSCALDTVGGPWAAPLPDDKIIIFINDPVYVNSY